MTADGVPQDRELFRFKKIAVASAFSPRFLPLLASARRFADMLGRPLSVIHVGPRTTESETRFRDAFADVGLDPTTEILWAEGNPAEVIVQTIEEQGIDLVIAGAFERELRSRLFLGDVARKLMRSAQCSVLLLTRPTREAVPLRRLALISDFTGLSTQALQLAIAIGEKEGAESIHVVRVCTIFAQALAEVNDPAVGEGGREAFVESEHRRLVEFIEAAGRSGVALEPACVEGTTGFAVSDYVEAIEADLLVIPSGPPGSDPLFPHRMDWILDVIPTNLFVLRAGGAGDP